MTNKEVLQEARKFVEKGWTQGVFARDKEGNTVESKDPRACKWNAMGALIAANPQGLYRWLELCSIFHSLTDKSLSFAFNDEPETTKEDVLALYDKAIARCNNDK